MQEACEIDVDIWQNRNLGQRFHDRRSGTLEQDIFYDSGQQKEKGINHMIVIAGRQLKDLYVRVLKTFLANCGQFHSIAVPHICGALPDYVRI